MRRLTIATLWVSSLMACAETEPVDNDPGTEAAPSRELGETQHEVRSAFSADNTYHTVGLTFTQRAVGGTATRSSRCSGAALSPHWILTAAHCLRDYEPATSTIWEVTFPITVTVMKSGGGLAQAYWGEFEGHIPTTWNPRTMPLREDVALVFLSGGPMTPLPPDWTRIYDDSITDLMWVAQGSWTGTPTTQYAGWGTGNTGANQGCPSLTSVGQPRKGKLTLTSSISNGDGATAKNDQQSTTCGGDSGGPWYVNIGSTELTFAITSQVDLPYACVTAQCVAPNKNSYAPLLTDGWIPWIEQTTAQTAFRVICRAHVLTAWDGVTQIQYRRCSE